MRVFNEENVKLLNKRTKDFKVEIGTVFKDDKRDLTIVGRKYITKKHPPDKKGRVYIQDVKYYKCKCNKCGWDRNWIIESHLIGEKHQGCSSCCNRTAVLGINTIWDTDRWMCDLGVSEEDAKKHTKGSSKYIEVTCPDCRNKKKIKISAIYRAKSIGCVCGDGFSYPEKFMYNILKQLNIEFETQYSPQYLNKKRSDFYIPSLKLVIETDGEINHRGGKLYNKNNKTLPECIRIDDWKDNQHKLNDIHTIRINCFKSNMNYIKQNILDSELITYLNFRDVDWVQADLYAIKSNKTKEICEYWKNKQEWETARNIGECFRINRTTVYEYLKKGTKLGWCFYNAEEELKKSGLKQGIANGKPVEIFKNGQSMGVFNSCGQLERESQRLFGIKLIQSMISMVCTGKRKQYKGFTFNYI